LLFQAWISRLSGNFPSILVLKPSVTSRRKQYLADSNLPSAIPPRPTGFVCYAIDVITDEERKRRRQAVKFAFAYIDEIIDILLISPTALFTTIRSE
jgi:hypothetical protein